MQREIKFRAWIKNENRMETCICVSPFSVGDCDRFYWKHDDVILEQYTGLKDKNGKEIYEGDVCDDARGFRFVVMWDEANVRFLGRCGEYIRYVGQEPAVEVVGNIHDNPELLK